MYPRYQVPSSSRHVPTSSCRNHGRLRVLRQNLDGRYFDRRELELVVVAHLSPAGSSWSAAEFSVSIFLPTVNATFQLRTRHDHIPARIRFLSRASFRIIWREIRVCEWSSSGHQDRRATSSSHESVPRSIEVGGHGVRRTGSPSDQQPDCTHQVIFQSVADRIQFKNQPAAEVAANARIKREASWIERETSGGNKCGISNPGAENT